MFAKRHNLFYFKINTPIKNVATEKNKAPIKVSNGIFISRIKNPTTPEPNKIFPKSITKEDIELSCLVLNMNYVASRKS